MKEEHMIIEIKNIPDGSKIKTVEFKIEFESQQELETRSFNHEPNKPNKSVKAPEFEITTESFPPSKNIPEPQKAPEPPKAQISSESVTQPYKEIPKEMLEMEL